MAGVIGNGGSNGQNTGGGSTGGTGGNDVSKVPLTRKINQYTLDKDILLTSTDVGALPLEKTSINGSLPVLNTSTGRYEWTIAGTGGSSNDDTKVPLTRTVNGKALSTDITITSSDVQALGINATLINGTAPVLNASTGKYEWTISSTDNTKVPLTRTVNAKPLSSNITLTAADVGALASGSTINGITGVYNSSNGVHEFTIPVSATDNTKVPLTRTVNAKPLSSNITLTASDVGALSILNTKINGASPVLDSGTGEYRWSITTSGSPDWSRLVVAGRSPTDTGNGLFQIPLGPADVGAVSYSNTKINNKFFGGTLAAPVLDLTPEDVGSLPITRTHINGAYPQYNSITKQYGWSISTGTDTTKVPLTRTINNISLADDIILSAADVGALPIQKTRINGNGPLLDVGTGEYRWNFAITDTTKVPMTRLVNGKNLFADITLDPYDVLALPATKTKINGATPTYDSGSKEYSWTISTGATVDWSKLQVCDVKPTDQGAGAFNINLQASDVSALPRNDTTINGKSFTGPTLTPQMTLTSADIGALPLNATSINGTLPVFNASTGKYEWTVAGGGGGDVPSTRTINGKALSADITLQPWDVNALNRSTTINGKAPLNSGVGQNTKYELHIDDFEGLPASRTKIGQTYFNRVGTPGNYEYQIDVTPFSIGAMDRDRTINGKEIRTNPVLVAEDLGALSTTLTRVNGQAPVHDIQTGIWNFALASAVTDNTKVPLERTINGLALTSNITLDNTHVNALKSDCRVNGKAFITTGQTYKEAILTAEDVDSISRATTINGYRLTTNPILNYQDVGAVKSGIRISGKQVTDIDVDIDNIDTRSLHRSATINGKSFVGQGGYTPSMVLTSTDIGSLPSADTTVNGSPFTFNNTTSKWEVTIPPQSGGVIDTRRINGYMLNQDISLNAADVGALQTTGISVNGVSTALDAAAGPNKFKITLNPLDIGAAARTTTVNGQPLTSNITLNSGDVGAVPVGRKINGLSLGQDISLTYGDVGALPIQKTYINGSKAVVDYITGDISWDIAIPSDAKNLKNDKTKINGALPTLNAGTGEYEWTVTAAATIPTKIEQTVNATGTQVPNRVQVSKDQIDIVGSGTVFVSAAAGATTKLRVIGEGSFAGAVDMLSMSITSDERVKSNIVSMDEVSTMMRNIELRKYTKAGKTEYGLIAQQAESVGAKFINHKDEDLLSVDLYDYVAHVHKYVQELEKKIDELTKKDK